MHMIIGLIFMSLNSFAVDWSELNKGIDYKLKQNIQLKQTERSSSYLELLTGESFELEEIIPLEMIQVTLFEFNYQKCPGPEMTTEMEIVAVEGSGPRLEVGVLLEKNCKLEIYIENKDLLKKSFFE